MNELEELRKKRMEELNGKAMQEQAEFQEQISQLEAFAKTLFTREALQRYGNLKSAHPEKAVHLLAAIGKMMQSGKARQITDEDLKRILLMIEPKKRHIRITRR